MNDRRTTTPLQMQDEPAATYRSVYRILLIDDDRVDRQNVCRLLGRHSDNYEVVEAATAAAGLDAVRIARPDCVLLDYGLPDSDGLNVLRSIGGAVPVVMLTGQGNEQIAVDAMKHGAQDYLSKDTINQESLRRAIHHAISVVQLQRTVSEQRQELQRRATELERSNRELRDFAYVASHDLQEPLRSISSFCSLLQDRYEGQFDAQADRWMDKVVRGAERMKTMIQDLLAYSRVATHGDKLGRVDCGCVFQEVVDHLLSQAILESSAVVTCDELPTVTADAAQLRQLLQNMIGNAIKYRSVATPRVHVSARRNGDQWEFSVFDNGIGINSEYFDAVFQMFKRLHGRDDYPGTGIGLAICQRIVHRHGGQIWVEANEPHGSTFRFTLPIEGSTDQMGVDQGQALIDREPATEADIKEHACARS